MQGYGTMINSSSDHVRLISCESGHRTSSRLAATRRLNKDVLLRQFHELNSADFIESIWPPEAAAAGLLPNSPSRLPTLKQFVNPQIACI